MKTTELTCIVCPMGCTLTVTSDGDEIISVEGNTCPRGSAYAKNELLHPVRTLTTTVKTENGKRLPVKTDAPIPKEHLFDAMEQVNRLVAPDRVKIGDVLLADLFGANLVATADLS